jgi:hypothetical protein
MLSVVFAEKRKGIIEAAPKIVGRRSADYDQRFSASESGLRSHLVFCAVARRANGSEHASTYTQNF